MTHSVGGVAHKAFIINRVHEQFLGYAIYVNNADRLVDVGLDDLLYLIRRHELLQVLFVSHDISLMNRGHLCMAKVHN
ncbi:MAG: hypothetical protein WBL50_07955 [Candidatus Acidiferrum sp.]